MLCYQLRAQRQRTKKGEAVEDRDTDTAGDKDTDTVGDTDTDTVTVTYMHLYMYTNKHNANALRVFIALLNSIQK